MFIDWKTQCFENDYRFSAIHVKLSTALKKNSSEKYYNLYENTKT